MSDHGNDMTRAERNDLLVLIRRREKVAKGAAVQRSTKLRADFEQQLDTHYSFNQSTIWASAFRAAQEVVANANTKVADECRKLGIPDRYAPRISEPHWWDRGENAVKERRCELRRLAYTQIEAIEKAAKMEVERRSVEKQTELISQGILSDAAKALLERLPAVEELMPNLDVAKVEALLEGKPA